MDPKILILLKVLDIASVAFLRLAERNAANEAFVAKVRAITIDQNGVVSDEQFAELMEESDALTAQIEALVEAKMGA